MEALSALCNGLIRPEPPPSRFVGLFVQLSPWRPQACTGSGKDSIDKVPVIAIQGRTLHICKKGGGVDSEVWGPIFSSGESSAPP